MFHHGRAPLQHLRVVEDARGLRRVVCGVNSDRHESCVHFDDGPIVLWHRERQAILSWLASIEELSAMDVLCSDKSGKLTPNIMTVEWKLPRRETSEQGFDSVDDMRSSSSTSGISMPNFEVLDAKIASALNKIIRNSQFKRKVSLEEQEAQKQDRFLSWKTDRLPDLRVLPGHWRQRFCRELCRPIFNFSSK